MIVHWLHFLHLISLCFDIRFSTSTLDISRFRAKWISLSEEYKIKYKLPRKKVSIDSDLPLVVEHSHLVAAEHILLAVENSVSTEVHLDSCP